MHFFDRTQFHSKPTSRLKSLHDSQQSKWLAYKAYLLEKESYISKGKIGAAPKTVNSPTGYWTEDVIREPLKDNFDSNCAYCGIYCDDERDGQVDHYFPKSCDKNADHIYSWENYVWSCPSCNNKKDNFYYVLDPCSQIDMNNVLFNPTNGKYQLDRNAPDAISRKFDLTDLKTFMNGKKRHKSRRLIYKQMKTIYLAKIRECKELLPLLSAGTKVHIEITSNLVAAEADLKEFIQEPNFIGLKRKIFNRYKSDYLITNTFEDYI